MQVVILFLMRFPSSIQLWKMGHSSVEHKVHLPDADVVWGPATELPGNGVASRLAMGFKNALNW